MAALLAVVVVACLGLATRPRSGRQPPTPAIASDDLDRWAVEAQRIQERLRPLTEARRLLEALRDGSAASGRVARGTPAEIDAQWHLKECTARLVALGRFPADGKLLETATGSGIGSIPTTELTHAVEESRRLAADATRGVDEAARLWAQAAGRHEPEFLRRLLRGSIDLVEAGALLGAGRTGQVERLIGSVAAYPAPVGPWVSRALDGILQSWTGDPREAVALLERSTREAPGRPEDQPARVRDSLAFCRVRLEVAAFRAFRRARMHDRALEAARECLRRTFADRPPCRADWIDGLMFQTVCDHLRERVAAVKAEIASLAGTLKEDLADRATSTVDAMNTACPVTLTRRHDQLARVRADPRLRGRWSALALEARELLDRSEQVCWAQAPHSVSMGEDHRVGRTVIAALENAIVAGAVDCKPAFARAVRMRNQLVRPVIAGTIDQWLCDAEGRDTERTHHLEAMLAALDAGIAGAPGRVPLLDDLAAYLNVARDAAGHRRGGGARPAVYCSALRRALARIPRGLDRGARLGSILKDIPEHLEGCLR
ncbi:MAG: hypothetical protein HY815_05645 [Candidatus Riflebacteria bacterium]|nr:hypothetical protein [Candidatus Riflebacteria bacterium]